MCGLIAAVNLSVTSGDLDLIRHRGPDDSGLETVSVGSHQVTLGHLRLSIVDLTPTGHQPMHLANGRASLIYNGEVYNHTTLRSQLKVSAFRGHSDTETLLHWLHERGIEGCFDFNGIFALAYLDHPNRRIYLARDPFGVKPLYYATINNTLIAASELAPLRRLLNPDIDAESISLVLRLRYLPAPYTLYKHIRKVRPGHYVQVDLAGTELTAEERPYAARAWSGPSTLSYDDMTSAYASHVERAVKAQMMSDVEVGVLLSGGVDSALISHHASTAAGAPLKAFSVGFEESHSENELHEARATADLIGMEFHSRVISENEFVGALQDIAAVIEEPLATTSVIPMHFLSELAAQHVKVVLSGQGADELVGGYRRYLGYGLASTLPKALGPTATWLTSSLTPRKEHLLRGASTLSARTETERLQAAYEVFSAAEIKQLTGHTDDRSREVIEYAYKMWFCAELPSAAARMMRLDLRMGLADDLLMYTDRISMRHSLECRVPFLDIDFVRFVESIPQRYKLTLFGAKKIHKAAARRVLPREITHRRKKGFLSPTNRWFRDSHWYLDLLADHGGQLGQYMDTSQIGSIISRHSAGLNQERELFLILMLAFVLNH